MQPGVYNIRLQRRADFKLALQFSDGNNNPINLSGWTALAQVWDVRRTTKYADFTVEYTDRALGKISIGLTAAQTTTFVDDLQYDVLLVNPSGFKEYYLEGAITPYEGFTA